MKKFYIVMVEKQDGDKVYLDNSMTDDYDKVRHDAKTFNEYFPDNKHIPCELCPVAMEMAQ